MVIIELILIVLGVVFMLISFRVTEKLTPKELEYLGSLSEDELKKIIEKELNRAAVDVDNRLDSIIDSSMEKVEVALDKETNAKIMAISEYSDTVLDNINRNHNEVMFLYSMLNDKHTELTEFASSLRATDFLAQKSVNENQNMAGQEIAAGSGDVMQEVIRAHSALAANSAKSINGIPQEVVQSGNSTGGRTQTMPVRQSGNAPVSPNQSAAGKQNGNTAAQPASRSAQPANRTAAAQPASRGTQPANRTAAAQQISRGTQPANRTAAAQSARAVSGNQGITAAQPGNIASAQSIRVVPGNQENVASARSGRVIASQTKGAAAAAGNTAVPKSAAAMQGVQPQKSAVKTPAAVTVQAVQETQTMQTESNYNGLILSLYRDGVSETDIAKQLGLGVGEVKLVIGLYKGES